MTVCCLALWVELEYFERVISRIHSGVQIVRFPKSHTHTKVTSHYRVKCGSFVHWSIIFQTWSPSRLVHFSPSWHEFKNSVAAEIRLLFLWPFRDDHFHFLNTVELAAPKVLLHWPPLCLNVLCSKSEMVHPWFVACQEPDFCCDRIFKLMPRSEKCIIVLIDCVEE